MNFEDLQAVTSFVFPSAVAEFTDAQLREAGRMNAERFVLWTGNVTANTFRVRRAYVPGQTAHSLDSGLCVTVPGEELHKLNRWLFEQEQTLAVQVHSHPTRAYHSHTDSSYPIVTQLGGLSIVVPDFAHRGVTGTGVAVYRLDSRGWSRLRGRKLRRLLHLDSEVP